VVAAASFLSEAADVLWLISLRRGVEGGSEYPEEAEVGVATLVMDDCAECPSRESDRLDWGIGPPLSETGSSDDCVCVRS
jgi:hypothetical protein